MHNRPAASLLHRFRSSLRYKELSLEDSVEKPVVLILSNLVEWLWLEDSGIAHQNVQTAKVLFSPFHESSPCGWFGNITGQVADLAGSPSYFSCRRLELRLIFSTQDN